MQMNIVCGGQGHNSTHLDSCEVNVAGTSHWNYTTPLPHPLSGQVGVTLDNRVFMTC